MIRIGLILASLTFLTFGQDNYYQKPSERNSFLVANNAWVSLPKGAIVHTPETHSKYIKVKPEGSRTNFTKFINQNRSWITLMEVDKDILLGNKKLSDEKIDSIKESPHMIILTHNRKPISTSINILVKSKK